MPWGNEDDVELIVRRLLKPIREKHKKKVERMQRKITMLEQEIRRLEVVIEHERYLRSKYSVSGYGFDSENNA